MRDATRYLSSHVLPGSTNIIVIEDDVASRTKNLIKFGQDSALTSLFIGLSDDDISLAISGNFVVVTVNYDWHPIFSETTFTTFGLGPDISLSFPLVSSYTMRAVR